VGGRWGGLRGGGGGGGGGGCGRIAHPKGANSMAPSGLVLRSDLVVTPFEISVRGSL